MSSVTVAELLRPVLDALVGNRPPVTVEFWDGSSVGERTTTKVVVRNARALRWLLWAPGELGLGRAYVAGDIDIEGRVFDALALREAIVESGRTADLGPRQVVGLAAAARRLGALGPPPRPPAEEARPAGRLHSRGRDAQAVTHHYDVSNDFYRLFLGSTLTYSCAYFADPGGELDEAQQDKYELVCRKLALRPGMRLLDVGCGWGGMVLHAATHHGVRAVGVTLAARQAELARERVADAGLSDRVEIRVQDYRDVRDGPFDAVSSIGMFEHVGADRLAEYFASVRRLLVPGGRFLNHGIAQPPGPSALGRRSFVNRFVFPDGELHEVGRVVSGVQGQGFEVRDVQSLREHYALTLRRWVANLEAEWDQACRLVGPARARIWRLYMAASALNFEAGRTSLHQVLAVRADNGRSGMPLRPDWTIEPAQVD